MTTSLSSSPIVPIVMAGVAGLLVVGTLSSSAPPASAEDPTAYVPVELPGAPAAPAAPAPAGDIVPAQCTATVCTITFPKEGDSAQIFGTTVTATKFYSDGITLTIGATPLTSNLVKAAKGGGYTTKTMKVDNGTASPHTVKVTKNK